MEVNDFAYVYSIFQEGLKNNYNLVYFHSTYDSFNNKKNQRVIFESLIYQYGNIFFDDDGFRIILSLEIGTEIEETNLDLKNNFKYIELSKSIDLSYYTDFIIYKWLDGKEYVCFLDDIKQNSDIQDVIKEHVIKQTINNYEYINNDNKIFLAFENLSDNLLYLIGDNEIITDAQKIIEDNKDNKDYEESIIEQAYIFSLETYFNCATPLKYITLSKYEFIMGFVPILLSSLSPLLGKSTTKCLEKLYRFRSFEIANRLGLSFFFKLYYYKINKNQGAIQTLLSSLKKEYEFIFDDKFNDKMADCLIEFSKSIYPNVANLSEYQKQLIFKQDENKTIAILLYEFASGTGEPIRNFDETSQFLQAYLNGGKNIFNSDKSNYINLKEVVINNFYNLIEEYNLSYKIFLTKYNKSVLTSSLEFSPSDEISLKQTLDNHLFSDFAQFFIGGANVSYFPTDKNNIVKVKVSNSTSANSLYLHISNNIERLNPPYKKLSKIKQNFLFNINIDETKFK